MPLTPLPTTAEFNLSLDCEESAPAQARAAIRELDPSSALIGDGMLLTSELVTNALRHSGCREGDRITLRANLSGDHLRIEVSDPARSGTVPRLASAAEHFGQMGLRVVEALSDRWGAACGDEQVVWAEITRR